MKKAEMMCEQYLLRLSLLSVRLSQCLELLVWSLNCKMFQQALPPFSQRGLNQGATMAAESHPHPYDTPLSKEVAINWRTAHSTLAITLLSPVSCTAWFKELGSGSPPGAKSRAISWQCLASTGKSLQYLSQEGGGVVQCQWDRNFPVWEPAGGGSEDNTRLRARDISSSCWSHS